ncbi:hypothetical protein ACFPRL_16090 [Pseudoclavibacter helvolus]
MLLSCQALWDPRRPRETATVLTPTIIAMPIHSCATGTWPRTTTPASAANMGLMLMKTQRTLWSPSAAR